MKAQREQREYKNGARVWVGAYQNSHNMPHWHYDCELIYVERGIYDVMCAQNVYAVEQGHGIFINSEQIHSTQARTPDSVAKMVLFDYNIIKPFFDDFTLSAPILTADFKPDEFFDTLLYELTRKPPFYKTRAEMLVAQKIIEISRAVGAEQQAKTDVSTSPQYDFKLLLGEIDEKASEYDLAAAAKFTNMSFAYCSKMFHKVIGITFTQYLNYIKTQNAVELLQTRPDLSITEVANRCGFSTIRNFNRIFKAFTGYTPKSLPHDYVMQETISMRNQPAANPTLAETILLYSSDDETRE